MMSDVVLKDVSFSYPNGFLAVDHINIEINSGENVAIVGQNGAGKTTTVKMMNGLLKPTEGNVLIGEMNTRNYTTAQVSRVVGYVFQNPDDQIFKYNVLDEVMFGPLNIGMNPETAKEKALKALELMGLSGKEKENPYDLDLHERKMVAIASVLAMDTEVIILDEPTIAQDDTGKKRISSMIKQLSDSGKLVIAILHDMDFVAENFERVIVMAHGTVLADGVPEEVFAQDEVLKKARLQKPSMTQLLERLGME